MTINNFYFIWDGGVYDPHNFAGSMYKITINRGVLRYNEEFYFNVPPALGCSRWCFSRERFKTNKHVHKVNFIEVE